MKFSTLAIAFFFFYLCIFLPTTLLGSSALVSILICIYLLAIALAIGSRYKLKLGSNAKILLITYILYVLIMLASLLVNPILGYQDLFLLYVPITAILSLIVGLLLASAIIDNPYSLEAYIKNKYNILIYSIIFFAFIGFRFVSVNSLYTASDIIIHQSRLSLPFSHPYTAACFYSSFLPYSILNLIDSARKKASLGNLLQTLKYLFLFLSLTIILFLTQSLNALIFFLAQILFAALLLFLNSGPIHIFKFLFFMFLVSISLYVLFSYFIDPDQFIYISSRFTALLEGRPTGSVTTRLYANEVALSFDSPFINIMLGYGFNAIFRNPESFVAATAIRFGLLGLIFAVLIPILVFGLILKSSLVMPKNTFNFHYLAFSGFLIAYVFSLYTTTYANEPKAIMITFISVGLFLGLSQKHSLGGFQKFGFLQ